MNKLMTGIVLGVVAAYAIKKLSEEKQFENWSNNANRFLMKNKKRAKDMLDMGENEIEYLEDRAKYMAKRGKRKLETAVERVKR